MAQDLCVVHAARVQVEKETVNHLTDGSGAVLWSLFFLGADVLRQSRQRVVSRSGEAPTTSSALGCVSSDTTYPLSATGWVAWSWPRLAGSPFASGPSRAGMPGSLEWPVPHSVNFKLHFIVSEGKVSASPWGS